MHKHIYECASCPHTPTHVQSAYILYTQTNRKRRIQWVNHIEKTIPRSGNSRWTGPGMGRGWHKENSSRQATVAGMGLVRDRNEASASYFLIKKMPWKFLLKKFIYQIILLFMVRLGNTMEWTRSNLGGWKILEPLKLLTVHYKAAESMKITKHGFLTPDGVIQTLPPLLRGQEAASPEGVQPWLTPTSTRPLHLTWDCEQLPQCPGRVSDPDSNLKWRRMRTRIF